VENLKPTIVNNYSKKVVNNLSNYSNHSGYIQPAIADSLVAEATEMMDNSDFKPYLYKTLFMIGKEKFLEAMNAARRANARCQQCYFAKVLKNMRDQVSG
jgi:hypothetical protein